jgi:hypothetical protein
MPIAKQRYTKDKKNRISFGLIYVMCPLDHCEANLLVHHALALHHAFPEGADEATHNLLDSIELC